MASGTHTFTSTGSAVTWTPSTGNVYPVRTNRRRTQASGRSAGGQRYVQDKGIEVVVYELRWANMSATDRNNLVTFFRHATVMFAQYTFTWNDLNDANHTVRFVDSNLDDDEVTQNRFAVVMELEEEL